MGGVADAPVANPRPGKNRRPAKGIGLQILRPGLVERLRSSWRRLWDKPRARWMRVQRNARKMF